MSSALLLAAVIAGAAGAVVGLPAWRSWQARAATERNTERYLAWRGRGDRSAPGAQELTAVERRRIAVGAALVVVAIVCLVIGLTTA